MDNLKKLAKEAKAFGDTTNWWTNPTDDSVAFIGSIDDKGQRKHSLVVCAALFSSTDPRAQPMAAFYAAANPQVILDLLSEISELKLAHAESARQRNELLMKLHVATIGEARTVGASIRQSMTNRRMVRMGLECQDGFSGGDSHV